MHPHNILNIFSYYERQFKRHLERSFIKGEIQIDLMNHALFATPAPQNDKSIKLFNSLQLLSLPGQTLNVDLSAKTAISSRRLGGTSQELQSVEVFIRKGVGTDRAEGGGGTSARGEELKWMEV
jgi:hypothetical protein